MSEKREVVVKFSYDGESVVDVERDVSEFIEAMEKYPRDAHGFLTGAFSITCRYEYEEKGDE